MVVALILMVILAIIGIIIAYYFGYSRKVSETELDFTHQLEKQEWLDNQIVDKENQLQQLSNQYIEKKEQVNEDLAFYKKEITLKKAVLDEEYENKTSQLEMAFIQKKQELLFDRANVELELNKLKATHAAAIEALRKEKEVAENPKQYQLPLTEDEIHDIEYLNGIRNKMRFPAVIGKVIWSSFIQKKINSFTASILGNKNVCGIYKITNQLTQECYIGQSVNIATRWSDHIKAGVGAKEVSNTNKLYTAMRNDGIENFSFELLLECPRDELNEQEKYFIELYQSNVLGYNSTSGNK